jgi:hypothetical protein
MIAADPAEWFGSPFQEHLRTGLVLLTPRIPIGDWLDDHAITNLSPEGFEFGLDPLAVLLAELLILQALLEVIRGHESHNRSLRQSRSCVLGTHQAMLHAVLTVGQVHNADPVGRF